VPGLAGHAKALTATFGALALITGVAAAVAPSVLASQDVPAAEATAAPTLATGAAAVSQPSIPATCETLDAQLETSDELFSSSDESSPPDTAAAARARPWCSPRAAATTPSSAAR
jgi:polygalacturonase